MNSPFNYEPDRKDLESAYSAACEMRTRFAEQLQQIAEAIGMPIAPGHSVVHRVRELITENNKLRENLWQHAERLEEVEMAAQAVVDRWETPLWKDAEPTAAVIYRLRDILANGQDEGSLADGNQSPQK